MEPTEPQLPKAEVEQKDPLEGNAYREDVEWLSDNAQNFNLNQMRTHVGEGLIESIVADAQDGKFSSRRRDPVSGEVSVKTYTADEIMTQLTIALEEQLKAPPESDDWLQYVTKSNTLRDAVGAVMKNPKLTEPFHDAVHKKQSDLEWERRGHVAPPQTTFEQSPVVPVADLPEVAASKNIINFAQQEVKAERTADLNPSIEVVPEASVTAEVARIEEEIDEHSQGIEAEAVEDGAEEMSFEEGQKIGEPAVEQVLENPEDAENDAVVEVEKGVEEKQLEQLLALARARHDMIEKSILETVTTQMNAYTTALEEAGGTVSMQSASLKALNAEKYTLLTIAQRVEEGQYDDGNVRKILNQALDTLKQNYSGLRARTEMVNGEVRGATKVLTNHLSEGERDIARNNASFNEHTTELVQQNPDVHLDAEVVALEDGIQLRSSVEASVNTVLESVKKLSPEATDSAQQLNAIIVRIEQVISESYSGNVDIMTLRTLSTNLGTMIENTTPNLDSFSNVVNTAIVAIRGTASQLAAK